MSSRSKSGKLPSLESATVRRHLHSSLQPASVSGLTATTRYYCRPVPTQADIHSTATLAARAAVARRWERHLVDAHDVGGGGSGRFYLQPFTVAIGGCWGRRNTSDLVVVVGGGHRCDVFKGEKLRATLQGWKPLVHIPHRGQLAQDVVADLGEVQGAPSHDVDVFIKQTRAIFVSERLSVCWMVAVSSWSFSTIV